jgi:type IV pilus assembly protein PilM
MLIRSKSQSFSPIGLDIRAAGVYAVQLEYGADAPRLHVAAAVPVRNEASREGLPSVSSALTTLLESRAFVGRKVVTAVPSGEVDVRPATLPPGVLPGDGARFEEALEAEARAVLAYGLDECVLDHVLQETSPEKGKPPQTEILLVAAKKENVNRHLALLQTVGLDCLHMDIGPCASARVLGEDDGIYAVVDIDSNRTAISTAQGRKLLFSRTLKTGMQGIVEELSRALEIDADQSAHLLWRYGLGPSASVMLDLAAVAETGHVPAQAIPSAIYEICCHSFESFARELKRSIDYFSLHHAGEAVQRVMVSGSLVPAHLTSFLEQRLAMSVQLADAFSALGNGTVQRGLQNSAFVVATGLALRREAL